MSKTNVWLPLHVGDYMADTPDLTTVEHGAYLLLLMAHWRTGDLPDDDVKLARITKLRLDHWRKIAPTVRTFFKEGENPGTLRQKRLHAELVKAKRLSGKRADSARSRWSKSGRYHADNGGGESRDNSLIDKETTDAIGEDLHPVCMIQSQLPIEGLRPSTDKPAGKPGRSRGKPKQVDRDLSSAPPGTAPVPNGSDLPKGKPGAKALFDDGLPKLNAMVGGDNRSLIGGWLKEHPDNAKHIHALIREAHRLFTTPGEALDNPKAWICARLAPKQAGLNGVVPEEANGWPVYEVAAYCRREAKVPSDHWPGLEKVVFRALMAELDPDRDIYPIMRSMLHRNPNTTGLGFIVNAFKDRIDGYTALRKVA